jgi:hypothetical protein
MNEIYRLRSLFLSHAFSKMSGKEACNISVVDYKLPRSIESYCVLKYGVDRLSDVSADRTRYDRNGFGT